MSVEHAIELLTHADVEWRRQGRELALTLDGEITAGLFDRFQHGRSLHAPAQGMTSELVEVLACSEEHPARRESIETIAPFILSDLSSLDRIVAGFPALHELRILLGHNQELPDLSGTRLRRLWIACPRWTADEFVLPDGLEALCLYGHGYGHGSYPELKNASSLRELETGQPAPQDMLDALAGQLERLHTRGPLPAGRFPKLRDLRCDYLTADSLDARLEHLHVERSIGRDVLDHPDVGPSTRIRVDRWSEALRTFRGERRVYWAGPVGDTDLWRDIVPTLPALEVLDLAQRHGDPDVAIPRGTLPSPNTLWQRENERPYLRDEATKRVLDDWAARGRDHALRSLDKQRRTKIQDIKHARTLSQIGLRDAKVLVEALNEGNFVALTTREGHTWQAWFRLVGYPTEMTKHNASQTSTPR